eukprot:Gb_19078 [translate_table: standard]
MEIEGLSVVCAGLGHADEDDNGRRTGYVASDNCLENLKDLQRFLRRDHPQTRDVFKQLGKWKTVPQDLIPIIEACRDEPDLVINAGDSLRIIPLTHHNGCLVTILGPRAPSIWVIRGPITCLARVPTSASSRSLTFIISLLRLRRSGPVGIASRISSFTFVLGALDLNGGHFVGCRGN